MIGDRELGGDDRRLHRRGNDGAAVGRQPAEARMARGRILSLDCVIGIRDRIPSRGTPLRLH